MKPRTIRLIGRLHAWLWKLTGGRFVDAVGPAPFLMLTTRGRKTGRQRRTPVLYLEEGAVLIAVASFGGNDMHPSWYLNLQSYPEAEVMVKGERRQVVAFVVRSHGDQRASGCKEHGACVQVFVFY